LALSFHPTHFVLQKPEIQLEGFDGTQKISPVDYVVVYSTVVVGLPDLQFFGVPSYKSFPTTIFVTESSNGTSPFNSFSIEKWINSTIGAMGDDEKESDLSAVVKIFSPTRLEERVLEEMFIRRSQTFVKRWYAYPYLKIKKDRNDGEEEMFNPIHLDSAGTFFLNGMEEWISCMETETISARNIANLILS
jgi:prenylcysteine oxidase/farnesylcysteine lyase